MKIFLGVIFLAAMADALSQGSPPSSTPETEVRQADEAWAKAVASRSVEQTLAFYDPDAVTAGSYMSRARGLVEFRALWEKVFAEKFCADVEGRASRHHRIRVDYVLKRDVERRTKPKWPVPRRVAQAGKRPMEGHY